MFSLRQLNMLRPLFLLFSLCILILTTTAASPPSFCKCTCFTNSTIIKLSSHVPDANPPRAVAATCSACNRAFCLSQHLPICKDAEDKDVFTTCFQRDSRKDQIVVLTFIAATLGLLGWAGVRRVVEKRKEMVRGDIGQGYNPVGQ
ncbi:hypothetical protein BJ878DRAFT_499422 [Calycina marina]|uniref:Uncharacterized protein n=1 Tax=Calycina marina TaxID=1763456 RepID=A0A9P7Z5Q1_9HELO|nr:hypothetical protein BJ878DRAFT_499422 [Calycina marina]